MGRGGRGGGGGAGEVRGKRGEEGRKKKGGRGNKNQHQEKRKSNEAGQSRRRALVMKLSTPRAAPRGGAQRQGPSRQRHRPAGPSPGSAGAAQPAVRPDPRRRTAPPPPPPLHSSLPCSSVREPHRGRGNPPGRRRPGWRPLPHAAPPGATAARCRRRTLPCGRHPHRGHDGLPGRVGGGRAHMGAPRTPRSTQGCTPAAAPGGQQLAGAVGSIGRGVDPHSRATSPRHPISPRPPPLPPPTHPRQRTRRGGPPQTRQSAPDTRGTGRWPRRRG